MDETIRIAVIGGSGLYEMSGLRETREYSSVTPFGKTSAPIVIGDLEDQPVAFLARHGLGHHLTPSEVPYQANIYALKSLGVERIISISACGSLKEEYAPGHIVIPDQIFDNTKNRPRSFFGEGLVGHIGVADPFCVDLSSQLARAVKSTGAIVHSGGTIITIEGPRFSTRAESNAFRAWGMSLIGMTTSPEAFLAKEAEMCYAVMAHVTDYDVWHAGEEPVSVEIVIQTLNKNTEIAQNSIKALIQHVDFTRRCTCENALASALITRRDMIPHSTLTKLGPVIKKYFGD
jgi:5'-methylthioadenosine phosphorylase